MMLSVHSPEYFLDLLKGKPADEGETRTWADGYTRKKVGKKWVMLASAPKAKEKVLDTAEAHYNHAMATNMGDVVEDVLQRHGVSDFSGLEEKIKGGTSDTAHTIYKDIVDTVKDSIGTRDDKQATMHTIGTALVHLRDQYAGPKAKVTVKKTSKTGKTYYSNEGGSEPPTLKASAIQKAKKKMGGWSVTGELSTTHVKAMLKTGAATVVEGKVDGKRKWKMPQKAVDVELKYKGESLKVMVKQTKRVGKHDRATAKVNITIPYEFVHSFLNNHVSSTKTRNNLLFRIQNSQGYRNFLKRAAS